MRTAERWVESSRAHARLSQFTSGSRPSSSRPGILRCLLVWFASETHEWFCTMTRFDTRRKTTANSLDLGGTHLDLREKEKNNLNLSGHTHTHSAGWLYIYIFCRCSLTTTMVEHFTVSSCCWWGNPSWLLLVLSTEMCGQPGSTGVGVDGMVACSHTYLLEWGSCISMYEHGQPKFSLWTTQATRYSIEL